MRTCNGCKFCCWAWAIEVPELHKRPLAHCRHECARGCAIYLTQPSTCRGFTCPYLEHAGLHRPDTFQEVLQNLAGNIGNYIPVVPQNVPIALAVAMIQDTKTVLAAVIAEGKWNTVALPLHRNASGGWESTDKFTKPWNDLCRQYAEN